MLSSVSEEQGPKASVFNDNASIGSVDQYDTYHPSYLEQKLKFSSDAPPRITLLGKGFDEEIDKSDKELIDAIKCLPTGLQLEIMKFIPTFLNSLAVVIRLF